MGMSYFFVVFADKCVMFQLLFTRLSESCLWECCVFSIKNVRTSQKSPVFPFTFHLFLLPEALQGFGRLCEVALGGFGFSIVYPTARLWQALGPFGRLWEALLCLGIP